MRAAPTDLEALSAEEVLAHVAREHHPRLYVACSFQKEASVITAAIGALLGIVLGIAFAAIVSRPLASDGFVFELPVGTLIAVAILAALAGTLAAIPPARRASRVDILRAVTTE